MGLLLQGGQEISEEVTYELNSERGLGRSLLRHLGSRVGSAEALRWEMPADAHGRVQQRRGLRAQSKGKAPWRDWGVAQDLSIAPEILLPTRASQLSSRSCWLCSKHASLRPPVSAPLISCLVG